MIPLATQDSLSIAGHDFKQYFCHQPSSDWLSHKIGFVFGSATTPPLPVTDFVGHDSKTGLFMKMLFDTTAESKREDPYSVLGVGFFANNWVEFHLDSPERVRFTDPTLQESRWGQWGKCECSGQQTRSCADEWCSGPSSRACKPQDSNCVSCPATCAGTGKGKHVEKQTCDFWGAEGHTCDNLEKFHGCDCHGCTCASSADGEAAWSDWSPCSVTCGDGKQGRGTRIVKAAKGTGKVQQPQGSRVRSCHPRDCPKDLVDVCINTSCMESDFCQECPNYISCASCYPGCKLRTKKKGFSDCKG